MIHLHQVMISDLTKIAHIDRKYKQGLFYGFPILNASILNLQNAREVIARESLVNNIEY